MGAEERTEGNQNPDGDAGVDGQRWLFGFPMGGVDLEYDKTTGGLIRIRINFPNAELVKAVEGVMKANAERSSKIGIYRRYRFKGRVYYHAMETVREWEHQPISARLEISKDSDSNLEYEARVSEEH